MNPFQSTCPTASPGKGTPSRTAGEAQGSGTKSAPPTTSPSPTPQEDAPAATGSPSGSRTSGQALPGKATFNTYISGSVSESAPDSVVEIFPDETVPASSLSRDKNPTDFSPKISPIILRPVQDLVCLPGQDLRPAKINFSPPRLPSVP